MQTRLFVGNLSYKAKEEDIKDAFAKFGSVQSVSIITDRYTGQSKGFAFVEMANSDDAQKALSMNGQDLMGRNITVAEAKPQEQRGGGRREGGPGPGRDRGSFGGRAGQA